MDWSVISFTLGASALATALLLPPGLALAWLLAKKQWPGKALVETFVALPLVIPPVATGLILLKLLGRRGPLGSLLENTFGLEIAFTWRAVVLAIGVMSAPLLIRTARVAFESVNPRLEQIARTLGYGELRLLFTITLPLALRGIVAGTLLAFARGLGEFGATIILAGNIPGQTTTLSLAIYRHIELGQDTAAFGFLAVSVGLAFAAVLLSEFILSRHRT